MEDKKKLILDFMNEKKYIPMKAKEMASILMVKKEDLESFRVILGELEKENKIKKNKINRYILLDKKYIEGKYNKNSKGYGFIEIEGTEEKIYVNEKNSKNALNGDTVLLEIIKDKDKDLKAEGKIIKILQHEKENVVGVFQKNKNFGFVIPDDKNFGTDIFISKKNCNRAKNNQKVVAKITKYPIKNKNAEGKIIEILGGVDEAGVDMLSVIREYDLPYEFPKKVLNEAENIDDKIDQTNIKNRFDFRDKIIFTIDGEDSKDLDDAVIVEKNIEGNYMLGVHIADVSYYVKENSELDKEARFRGTSIYMFDKVIPMLPKKLSNGICSLNAGEDRYTLSVIMEIDKNGNIIDSEILKGIINVKERMNYTDVQKILEGKDKKVLKKYKEYIDKFKLMEELANLLETKRLKEGSINLDIPESKIILDKNGFAIDVKKYELTVANNIIEQFMLLANETVAEKFYWLETPFIYRVHEAPDMDKIKELNKYLFGLGYKIKGNKENIHPKSFANVLEEVKGKEEEKIIANLILHTLKIAKYESENKGHFGIASKYYCHFTSPIRRYPDLFIHRIISKYIDNEYNIDENSKNKYNKLANEYADSSSKREKIAQKVERESVDIKKCEFMQHKIGEKYDGIISNITPFGVFVELENTIEGLIKFENLGKEFFIYDDEHKKLIGEETKTVYRIGDKIKVEVIYANKILRQIDFKKIE